MLGHPTVEVPSDRQELSGGIWTERNQSHSRPAYFKKHPLDSNPTTRVDSSDSRGSRSSARYQRFDPDGENKIDRWWLLVAVFVPPRVRFRAGFGRGNCEATRGTSTSLGPAEEGRVSLSALFYVSMSRTRLKFTGRRSCLCVALLTLVSPRKTADVFPVPSSLLSQQTRRPCVVTIYGQNRVN